MEFIKDILIHKISIILIILLMLLGNKYNYAYSENKLIINENVINTYENMYTKDDINYINIDLLINSGLNIKKEESNIPMVSMIYTDIEYMLFKNGATKKENIVGKYVNEVKKEKPDDINDDKYFSQILETISL